MEKVLIITHGFLPDIGGAQRVAYDYANNLIKLGYDVTVICREYRSPIRNTDFKLLMVPNKYGLYFWMFNFGHFFSTHNLNQYDYIILNQIPCVAIAGKYFPQDILDKCISIIQGVEVEWAYQNRYFLSNFFYNKLLKISYYHRYALIHSRKIVSVSNFHKWKVINAAQLENFSHKFKVVYTGIDIEVFHPVDSDVKEIFGLEGKELLLTVSRVIAMKGYLEMLSIFEQLIAIDKNFVWMIIGDGSFLNKLKDIVLKKDLCKNIIFLGERDREKLNYYYSAADCFWLLSNYDECLPLVYLEAQACGVPAIGRMKGGVVETILHNKTGFLITTDDECLEILVNKRYKSIDKQDLKNFIKKFNKINATNDLIN